VTLCVWWPGGIAPLLMPLTHKAPHLHFDCLNAVQSCRHHQSSNDRCVAHQVITAHMHWHLITRAACGCRTQPNRSAATFTALARINRLSWSRDAPAPTPSPTPHQTPSPCSPPPPPQPSPASSSAPCLMLRAPFARWLPRTFCARLQPSRAEPRSLALWRCPTRNRAPICGATREPAPHVHARARSTGTHALLAHKVDACNSTVACHTQSHDDHMPRVLYLNFGYLAVGMPKNILAIDTSLRTHKREAGYTDTRKPQANQTTASARRIQNPFALITTRPQPQPSQLQLHPPVYILIVCPCERQHVSPQRALAAAGVGGGGVAAL